MGFKRCRVLEFLRDDELTGLFRVFLHIEPNATRLRAGQADMLLQGRAYFLNPVGGYVQMAVQDYSHSIVPGGFEVMS